MRNQHGRFVRGVSGNPDGRPRAVREANDLIDALIPELIIILLQIARDPAEPARARIIAVNSLLDRRFGRSPRDEFPCALMRSLPGEQEQQEAPPAEPVAANANAAAPPAAEPASDPPAEPAPTATSKQPHALPDTEPAEPGRRPLPEPARDAADRRAPGQSPGRDRDRRYSHLFSGTAMSREGPIHPCAEVPRPRR